MKSSGAKRAIQTTRAIRVVEGSVSAQVLMVKFTHQAVGIPTPVAIIPRFLPTFQTIHAEHDSPRGCSPLESASESHSSRGYATPPHKGPTSTGPQPDLNRTSRLSRGGPPADSGA